MVASGHERLSTACLAHLRRAVITSLIVGTALVLINHGDHLLCEPICPHFWLKCGLCYAVPFLVSLVSATLATASRATTSRPGRPRL